MCQYDFEIKYKPGIQNVEADSLSRSPINLDFHHEDHLKIVNMVSEDEIKRAQQNERAEGIPMCFQTNDKGIFVKRRGLFTRFYIPVSLRAKIIDEFHHKFGHIGIKKMLQMISKSFYWPDMTNDVKLFVDTCVTCCKSKIKRSPKLGSLSITGPAREPFEIVSIDTVGGFEGYQSPKKYLHLAIDHFTRFVWHLSSKNQKASDFKKLLENVLTIGKPKLLISDNYPGIVSRSFKSFLSQNEIEFKLVPTYCPKSNGMVERVNQTIVDRMRCKFREHEGKIAWPIIAQQSVYEYNNSLHSSTGFSPRFLLTGISLFESSLKNLPKLEEARRLAFEKSLQTHEISKKHYDRKHSPHIFCVGDLVLIDNHSMGKLSPRRIGPYRVIEKLSDNSYRINFRTSQRGNNIVNAHQMTPYHSSHPEND